MDPLPDAEATLSRELMDFGISNPNPGSHFDAFEQPPPPKLRSEGVVSKDITQKFRSAVASLKPGELVKDGFFTLFESVGALEVMDPKMDSGRLAPGESLDDDYDVTRPLLPNEVVGIIDQLLSLEMAWHLGYPLSQTLFTSVYVEKMLHPAPKTLEEADFIRDRAAGSPRDPMHAALRAYCLGLLKSCYYVNERIKYEHSYEEEDFVTNPYNRSLLETIDRYEIRDEIMEARKIIHDISHTLTDELAHALSFRLELRTAFLRAIELSELRSDPESLSLPWSQMQGVWEVVNKSRHLGKPAPEAFSTKIQRRLASTMPPRPIVQPSAEETHEHFKKLIADGINVLNVLHYSDSQSLLNFVLTFQAQKPQPLVYIRAILQNLLFHDMVILGRLSIRQVLDDDLSIVVLPSSILLDRDNDSVEAPHHPRYAIAHQMELFRQRAAQSYLDIFRAFCQNRCRVRRTLFHSLQDWEMVQADAEEIDQLLQLQTEEKPVTYPPLGGVPSHSLPLSSWAYHYKLRLMEWTVQLGFELEIYQPDELAGMYWYLSHLSHTRVLHLERIGFFTTQRLEPPGAASSSKTRPAAPTAQLTRSKSYLHLSIREAAATSELADALSQLYTSLRRLGLVTPPARPYSTDALRYEVRMKPFAPIGLPALPAFDEFARAVDRPDVGTAQLLDGAAGAAARARATLEGLARMGADEAFAVGCFERWRGGVREWNKAAIAVGLAVAAVRRVVDAVEEGGEGGEGVKERLSVQVPRPEEGYHEWWVVPKVVERGGV
ncbi:Mak10 subunit, NatC N-terminal acetyltransferase-domain-containing protein [Chaetomium sp. MPI-CAGE-AT-0009]|nr:Mak10 subunit, NatC N-terminal acetyltransferase-domain-containing protein [Chaetomium sp. MPI-CAGE-AT-0009]